QPARPGLWLAKTATKTRLRFKEPQIERREHQDNADVHHQPRPELVPEEQDVHADHDAYQREHVKHDGNLSAHLSFSTTCCGSGARAERLLPFYFCADAGPALRTDFKPKRAQR